LGMVMPARTTIFGIEISDATTFSEKCTPQVEAAIPRCADMIINELDGDTNA
jgi:hypothetical protein